MIKYRPPVASSKPAGANSYCRRRQSNSKRRVVEDTSDGLSAISELPSVSSNHHEPINFVLNSETNYFSPLDAISEASDVQNDLENFFQLESLGIKENISNCS